MPQVTESLSKATLLRPRFGGGGAEGCALGKCGGERDMGRDEWEQETQGRCHPSKGDNSNRHASTAYKSPSSRRRIRQSFAMALRIQVTRIFSSSPCFANRVRKFALFHNLMRYLAWLQRYCQVYISFVTALHGSICRRNLPLLQAPPDFLMKLSQFLIVHNITRSK